MTLPNLPPPLPEPVPPKAWGFWATLLLGLLIMAGMIAVQALVFVVFVVVHTAVSKATGIPANPNALMERLQNDPLVLASSVFAAVPVIFLAVWLLVRFRDGWRFREYVALHGFGLRQFGLWLVALLTVMLLGNPFLRAMGDTSGEAFMGEMLTGGRFLVPLLLAVILAAPLSEELLFRGFMFRGLAESRWGLWPAIFIPNVLWVLLHVQYSWPTLVVLFAMGIVLGLARKFSGSVSLPMVLHFVTNLLATIGSLLGPPELP